MTINDLDDTAEFYVGIGEEGNVLAVFNAFDDIKNDKTEGVVSYGILSTIVNDYDEIYTQS